MTMARLGRRERRARRRELDGLTATTYLSSGATSDKVQWLRSDAFGVARST